MIPFAPSNNLDFRSLAGDDIASVGRTYSGVNGLPQTTGGRGRLLGTLKKSAGCTSMATGVGVRAYLASQGLEGANSVETFSGSQLRQGLAGEPFNGSIELNVAPGGPYTIYARTFESGGSGFYLAGRYNGTATNSNTPRLRQLDRQQEILARDPASDLLTSPVALAAAASRPHLQFCKCPGAGRHDQHPRELQDRCEPTGEPPHRAPGLGRHFFWPLQPWGQTQKAALNGDLEGDLAR